ncbi:uncharacterized protein LOC123296092 [Chrysoperla carnea]|uniref:uncharacterized protein LOC123296092 n=1 Tax=Chrysoperla carnea TaxID=189513 RepID=UPI001D0620D2|nr:uncharacterized protein LOC123296092 [Chrysoperla carnea]
MSLNQLKLVRSQKDIPFNDEIENVFDNVDHLYSDKKRVISFGSSEVLDYKFPIIEDAVKEDESEGDKIIIAYFKQHKIQELFHTLLTHMLIKMPDDPVQYLICLLERFNLYVTGEIQEPPLVFRRRHIESIFQAMDIFDSGTITVNQYFSGSKTMGIFTKELPVCNKDGLIKKEEFFKNAYSGQLTMVNEIVMLQMWWDLMQEDQKQTEAISRYLLDSRHIKNDRR